MLNLGHDGVDIFIKITKGLVIAFIVLFIVKRAERLIIGLLEWLISLADLFGFLFNLLLSLLGVTELICFGKHSLTVNFFRFFRSLRLTLQVLLLFSHLTLLQGSNEV